VASFKSVDEFHIMLVVSEFHEKTPEIDGDDEMAPSTEVLFIIWSKSIIMLSFRGILLVPFAGDVLEMLGGPSVLKLNRYG
jgi:hypothetical protein